MKVHPFAAPERRAARLPQFSSPAPKVEVRETPPPPPPQPGDFFESSRSLKRDGLMAGALLAPLALPPMASLAIGGVVGTLGLVAGYGEMREGMRTMRTREVLDGVLHMGASSAMLTSALVSNPFTSAIASGVGLALMGAKLLVDHPKDVVDVALYQPLKLVTDAGKSIWNEFK